MGLTLREFLNTTPRYFVAARKGYARREQAEWERARYIAFYAVTPHVKKGSIRRMRDLGVFPWEKEGPYTSDAMRKEAEELLRKRAAELFGGNWVLAERKKDKMLWDA